MMNTMIQTETYDPVKDVLSQPEEEQLEYALELLRYYTCPAEDEDVRYLAKAFELDPQTARLLSLLKKSEGRIVTAERIGVVLWGPNSDHANLRGNIGVAMCKLRKKIPKEVTVTNQWGTGYVLNDPEDLITKKIMKDTPISPPRLFEGRPWSPQEDELLIRMIRHDAQIAECSLVLRRTVRAVQDRKRHLEEKVPDLMPKNVKMWR